MHLSQTTNLLICDLVVARCRREAVCECCQCRINFSRFARRRNVARDLPDISFGDIMIAPIARNRETADEFKREELFETIADIATRNAELKNGL